MDAAGGGATPSTRSHTCDLLGPRQVVALRAGEVDRATDRVAPSAGHDVLVDGEGWTGDWEGQTSTVVTRSMQINTRTFHFQHKKLYMLHVRL